MIIQNDHLSSSNCYEWFKCAVLLTWFVLAVISNWIVLAYVHDLVDWTPMDDPVFQLIPQQDWATHVGDVMVALAFVFLILLITFHRHRILIMRRIIFLLAMLNTLRAIAIFITRLPSSFADNEERCRAKLDPSDRNFMELVKRTEKQSILLGLQLLREKHLCGDQFFSGHTLILVLAYLCVEYYLAEKYRYWRYLPRFVAIVGIPCLVISRTHYTIDVVAAYFVTISLFVYYHTLCESDDCKWTSLYRTFYLSRAIYWFEEKVPRGKVENEHNFPLPLKWIPKLVRRLLHKNQQQIWPTPTVKVEQNGSS